MSFIANILGAEALTTVYTSAKYTVGSRVRDNVGDEYIFLAGVASTGAGTWVIFDELGVTTRLVAGGIGPVAIAQAATIASTWGWYKIFGTTLGNVSTGFADNGLLYATATAGEADDEAVSGDRITNSLGRSAISSGQATVQLNYPYMAD